MKYIKESDMVNIDTLRRNLFKYDRVIRLRNNRADPNEINNVYIPSIYNIKYPTYTAEMAEDIANNRKKDPVELPLQLREWLRFSREKIIELGIKYNLSNKKVKTHTDLDWALNELEIHKLEYTLHGRDKGLGGEIVDNSYHNYIVLADLNNETAYLRLDITESIRNKITSSLKTDIQCIIDNHFGRHRTDPIYLYLRKSQQALTAFSIVYPLYKYHKEGELKMRLICAQRDTNVLYQCNKFIQNELQSTLHLMCPHSVKDSKHVIKILSTRSFPPDATINTTDLVNMYPSIRIADAIDHLDKYMNFYEKKFNTTLPHKALILELAQLVLSNNYVYFTTLPTIEKPHSHTTYYKQLVGMPMGASSAPVISNIFVCMVELKAQFIALKSPHIRLPLLYLRILDDILTISSSAAQFKLYLQLLQHPSLTYTVEADNTSNIFMDMCIYKDANFNTTGIFSTILFQKLHNLFIYLRLDSLIPNHIIVNFIQQEIYRIRMICSHDSEYEMYKYLFYHRLLKRQYTKKKLDPIFNACNPNRHDLIHGIKLSHKEQTQHQYLVLTYSDFSIKHNSEIQTLLTPPADILALYPFAFEDPTKPHVSYRLEKNVKTHAKQKYDN